MSNILNSIDGVEPSDGVIRFFSANNTETVKLNKAFLTRMNGIWKFDLNTMDSITKRINELFPLAKDIVLPVEENPKQQILSEQYAEKALHFELSLREITNHLCRYLMDELNGLKEALLDLDRFVKEKEIFTESDEVTLAAENGNHSEKKEKKEVSSEEEQ